MNENKQIIEHKSVRNFIYTDKGRNILIIAGLVAVVLIFISGFVDGSDVSDISAFDTTQYCETLEEDINEMLSGIEGAGNCSVLLTIDSSYEYVYLDDGKTLQMVREPEVRGVVVACEGGDSAVVCSQITELLTTLLSVPSNKVCITKLK